MEKEKRTENEALSFEKCLHLTQDMADKCAPNLNTRSGCSPLLWFQLQLFWRYVLGGRVI